MTIKKNKNNTPSVLVWRLLVDKLEFLEFIQKPTLHFTLIIKTHLPGSSKGFNLKLHDKPRNLKKNIQPWSFMKRWEQVKHFYHHYGQINVVFSREMF